MTTWTDDRIELLRKRWADGASASTIAAEIGGITRNAVIGKVSRLGLPGRERATVLNQRRRTVARISAIAMRNPKAVNPFGIKGAAALVERRERAPDGSLEPDATLARIEQQGPPAEFLGIPFLDLEPQHCRYPRGEGAAITFCGQPRIADSSYCAACHIRCHNAAAMRDVPDDEHERRSLSARRMWARKRAQEHVRDDAA